MSAPAGKKVCPECGHMPMEKRGQLGLLACLKCGKVVPAAGPGDGDAIVEEAVANLDQELAQLLGGAAKADITEASDKKAIDVPDEIGYMVGWRSWRLTQQYGEWRLKSVTPAGQSMIWTPREAMEASCGKRRHEPGQVPVKGCTCGFYTAKTLEHLLGKDLKRYTQYEREHLRVVGEVAIWGRYREGKQGWRSQFAYPKRLLVPYEAWEVGPPLKEAYGVPVELNNWISGKGK